MGEASFTPGPWRVDDAGDIVAGPYNVCIPYATKPEDKTLMAAGPDMVAALDTYADQLCEGWCEQSPDFANFDDCGGCLARRVAWRARGGEKANGETAA